MSAPARRRPHLFPVLCFVFLWISACASPHIIPVRRGLDASEERWVALSEQVAKQQNEIEHLTALLEMREGSPKTSAASQHKANEVPSVPVKTLHPPKLLSSATKNAENTDGGEEKEDIGDGADEEETVVDSSQEAMHFYYLGLQRLREHQYEDGSKQFTKFLSMAPAHVYADRAQYWLVELHFLNKDFGLVGPAANLLEARYPYSVRIPDAMYRRAMALQGMGQGQAARTALRDLVKKFPKTPTASRAARTLAGLSPAVSGLPAPEQAFD